MSSVPSGCCASKSLALPAALSAQSFKVQKWNIGGEGGTDYLTAEPGTGRVSVSRGTHVLVVDGRTGKMLGDIPNAPRNHGIALAETAGHGFITASGDSSVIMFDLETLAELRRTTIPQGGQDGIMYDACSNRVILTNHSRPVGTGVALDADTGEIVGTVNLERTSPEGASAMQAIDERTWTVTIARQNGADCYTVVAAVPTVSRASRSRWTRCRTRRTFSSRSTARPRPVPRRRLPAAAAVVPWGPWSPPGWWRSRTGRCPRISRAHPCTARARFVFHAGAPP